MYTSMWLQSVQGLGALQAGLVILPIPAVSLVVSVLSGRFLHAVSPRWTIGLGMLLVGAGVAGQAVLTGDSGWAALVPGAAVVGVGVGVAVPNVTAATMASVPPERVGMAAGAVSTFRQLGFAVSVAVLGTVFRAKLQDALDHTVSEAAAYASGLNATFLTVAGPLVRCWFARGPRRPARPLVERRRRRWDDAPAPTQSADRARDPCPGDRHVQLLKEGGGRLLRVTSGSLSRRGRPSDSSSIVMSSHSARSLSSSPSHSGSPRWSGQGDQ
ncbi:MFS transporter [Nonomuraea spiralis]|uniref:MFS transporter n=1 Tax=Nonomuraea spiralis TaxID=46182 RepID=UPI0037B92DB4